MAKLRVGNVALALATALVGAAACSDDDRGNERADSPPPDARCPVSTREGGCRAAGQDERVTIASGGTLLPAAGFAIDDGSGYLAFALRWGDARMLSSKSKHLWAFDAASALPWGLAQGATGVTVRGEDVLYFVARTESAFSLQRSRIDAGVLGPPSPVVLEGGGGGPVPSWPQAVGLADGRVLLAFVVPQQEVLFGVDDGTGDHFRVASLPVREPDLTGVLAHVGTTARGSWVIAYQVADARWVFRSHVLLSRDEGDTWSDANGGRVAEGDVFHAFPVARRDEGADVYYVKKSAKEQTIWRRALHEDGTVGAEQPVTSAALGNVTYPQPRRLRDGRIAMMLGIQRGGRDRDLALVILDGDAP